MKTFLKKLFIFLETRQKLFSDSKVHHENIINKQ